MNIVDLVKTIESIENPQNLKIIREGACFYQNLAVKPLALAMGI